MSTDEKKFYLQSVIFNRAKSKLKVLTEKNIIRTSLLYSHYLHVASTLKVLFNTGFKIDELNVFEKIQYIRDEILPYSTGLTKEELDSYQRDIEFLKKKKHKTKNEILRLTGLTSYINRVVDNDIKKLDKNLAAFGFKELIPFKDSKEIRTYQVPLQAEADGKPDKLIQLMCTVFNKFFMYPVLDDSVENIGMNKTIMMKHFWNHFKKKNLILIKQFLFRIPDTSMFNYTQTMLTRNEIIDSIQEFINQLSVYSYNITKTKFAFTDRSTYDIQFKGMLYPLLTKIQKTIDDCPYISYARNHPTYQTEYEVYFCLAPVKNIIKIYTALEIISKTTELYILEELRSKMDVEKCKAFFYHKPVKVL